MTHPARLVVTALAILSWAQAAAAQTVDEVVEKHLAALGGRAALVKLTSRTMTGTITVSTPVGDLSGPVEILNQAPSKARTRIDLDLTAFGAGKMTYDERFDGTTGFVLDSMQGNRELTGIQLDNRRNETFPTPFLGFKDRGDAVELAGKEVVGDGEAYVLVLRPKTGPIMRRYIDATSFLETRIVVQGEAPQVGAFEQTVDLLDYRDVDGVRVPFTVMGRSTFQTFTVRVVKASHNEPIDQALFVRPAN